MGKGRKVTITFGNLCPKSQNIGFIEVNLTKIIQNLMATFYSIENYQQQNFKSVKEKFKEITVIH